MPASLLLCCAAMARAAVLFFPYTPACADPTTHEFRIVSARTASRSECGSGVCHPACQMHATLKNVGSQPFPGLALVFGRPQSSNVERDGIASFTFRFPALKPSEVAGAARFQDGLMCRQIEIGAIRGECIGGLACRPGATVKIVGADMPAIETRTVDVGAPHRAASTG